MASSHTAVSYLCQETSFLCKFLKSFVNELQVQAGALGRGAVVFVFPVTQKVDVSAMVLCGQFKKGYGQMTLCTFDPRNTDSNRRRSEKCCVFLCEGKKKIKHRANKMTELFHTHTHAWIGGIEILTALDLLLNGCRWGWITLRDPFVDQFMKLRCGVVIACLFLHFLQKHEKRKSLD